MAFLFKQFTVCNPLRIISISNLELGRKADRVNKAFVLRNDSFSVTVRCCLGQRILSSG